MNQQYITLLKDFGCAFNDHDADKLVAMMTNDAIFYTVAGNTKFGNKITGIDNIRQAFQGVWTQMPDAHWQAGDIFISGDRGLSDWIFSGTDKDTHHRIEAQGCDIFTFRDGKIAIKNAFRKQVT